MVIFNKEKKDVRELPEFLDNGEKALYGVKRVEDRYERVPLSTIQGIIQLLADKSRGYTNENTIVPGPFKFLDLAKVPKEAAA